MLGYAIANPTYKTKAPDLEEEKYSVKQQSRHTSRSINLRLRFTILQRDNFSCCGYGRSPATNLGLKLQVDHIKA
jgi:hypothetical protein